MIRRLAMCIVLGAVVATARDLTAPACWSPTRTVDGIEAWGAQGNGDYWGFARGRVHAPAAVILERITNFALLPSLHPWLDRVRVLERGPDHARVYFHYDLPWPLADRSYTAEHHWGRDASGAAFLDIDDAGSHASPADDAVHVERVLGRMRFTPVEDGSATDVEYLLRADLAGLLPRSVRAQSAWKIPLNVVLSLPRAIDPRFAVR